MELNENSTGYLEVTFYDKNGVAAQPSSARYQVHDATGGGELVSWQALSPTDGVAEIKLDAVVTAIVTAANAEEIRVVTVEGTYGPNDKVAKQFRVVIRNLRFYS